MYYATTKFSVQVTEVFSREGRTSVKDTILDIAGLLKHLLNSLVTSHQANLRVDTRLHFYTTFLTLNYRVNFTPQGR